MRTYTYKVGFNVVCSDLQAIPEPRMAEQAIVQSRFFIVFFREPLLSKRGKTCEAIRAGLK